MASSSVSSLSRCWPASILADHLRRAEIAGGFLLMRVAGQDDDVGAGGLGGELGGESDRAGADDQDGFSLAEGGHVVAVHPAGERLRDGGDFAVDVGRGLEDGDAGSEDILGHAAVDRDADESAGDLALVVVTRAAVPAGAAAEQGFDPDYVALFDVDRRLGRRLRRCRRSRDRGCAAPRAGNRLGTSGGRSRRCRH